MAEVIAHPDDRRLEQRARRSLVPLMVEHAGVRAIVGTATLVHGSGHDRHGLLTARHVSESIRGFTQGGGRLVLPLDGRRITPRRIAFRDHPDPSADLGWIFVDAATTRAIADRREFIDFRSVARPENEADRYLVVGYPTDQGLILPETHAPDHLGIVTGPYLGPNDITADPVHDHVHLLLAYEPTQRIRALHGLSGCAVWAIRDHGSIRFVGIQTSYIEDRWVRATRRRVLIAG